MANKHATLTDLFTDMANAIRAKKNSTDAIIADDFPAEIDNLRTGFDYVNSDVTTIPDYAFYGCEDIKSVDCANLTNIGKSAFNDCTSLKSITIPSGVTSIGHLAFYDTTMLTEINFNAIAMSDFSDYNDVFWCAGQNGSGINVNIGNSVTKIPSYLFVPETTCADSKFPKITSVVFAEGSVCESIGKMAFCRCSTLANIDIPNSVTSIGEQAFQQCTLLKSVTIGNGVTRIYYRALGGCSSLTNITFKGTIAQWNAITKGTDWNQNVPATYVQCSDGQVAL